MSKTTITSPGWYVRTAKGPKGPYRSQGTAELVAGAMGLPASHVKHLRPPTCRRCGTRLGDLGAAYHICADLTA